MLEVHVFHLISFRLAVFAAVNASASVGKLENALQTLLDAGNTARIPAAQNIDKLFGQFEVALLFENTVLYNIDGYSRIDVAEDV
jgi:hypothetical protein